MSEREDGEQSMIAGGGTGQYTSEANKDMAPEAPDIALTDEDAPILQVTPHDTLADNGRAKVQGSTPTSGPPTAAATQPTPESAGCKRPTPDWP